jgi:serine/threonine-protein kinase
VATEAGIAGLRIVASIGRGAMGEVFRARDEEHGRDVALKLLDEALDRDERFRQRFLRESEIAATIDHPHVVRTLASGEADGRLYLVMELVEGSDLREILRRDGALEPERSVEIVGQAGDALDAAHALGLVHRDVKPGNILVAGDDAFVCDFGLARHVTSVSSLTGDRGFVGTIDYVPPEQIEGAPTDARADVYSLGCVLYECLTGRRPFDRDSELATVFAHLNEPPPRATYVRPELSAAFDDVIATALAKSPDDRYSSCGELAEAARAALSGRVVRRRRRRPRTIVLAATGLAVVAAVAAVFATRGAGSPRLPVTITPTSIRGARLGDSNLLLQKLWNGGQELTMDTPGNYSVLTQRVRNLGAYFIGTNDHAVELTTWNANDRTAEGVGPCSSLSELKRAYGNGLRPSPNNTSPAGVVYAWLLGKNMAFTMDFPKATKVETVALFDNDRPSATYIASNDGPCAPAETNATVRRPPASVIPKRPKLSHVLVSRSFRPQVKLKTPSGWRIRSDTAAAFVAEGPRKVDVTFRLDPLAAAAGGGPLRTVWVTATSLSNWLSRAHPELVAQEGTQYAGGIAYNAIWIDLRPGARKPYIAFADRAPALLPPRPGHRERLYLIPIRIGSLQHTLAILVDAPSRAAYAAYATILDYMLRHFEVAAAPAGILTALSSQCTPVWRGTCSGELTPGTHRTQSFRPAFTYRVPLGWTNTCDQVACEGLIPPGGDFAAVDIGKSDYIDVFTRIASAQYGCGSGPGPARTPAAFVRWLRRDRALATTVAPAHVGGLSGFDADIRIRKGWTGTCPGSPLPTASILVGLPPSPGNLAHSLNPPILMRLFLLRYHGGTLAIEIDDVTDDLAKLASYMKVVKTFRFKLH